MNKREMIMSTGTFDEQYRCEVRIACLHKKFFDDEIGSCMKSRQLSSMLMTLVVWKAIENRVTSSKHLSFSSRTSIKRVSF